MPQKLLLSLLVLLCLMHRVVAQPANNSVPLPVMASAKTIWVDSVYNAMSITQKIGQLFMIAAYSGGEKYNQPLIEKLINENI